MKLSQVSNLVPPALAEKAIRASHWAHENLLDLLSRFEGQAENPQEWELLLRLDGPTVTACARRKTQCREFGSFALTNPAEARRVMAASGGERALPVRTILSIGSDRSVVRTLNLPTNDDVHIAAIVKNKIERLGPWPASAALFGHRVEEWDPERRSACISIAIAGREATQAVLACLEDACISIHRIEVRPTEEDEAIALWSKPSEKQIGTAHKVLFRYAAVNAALGGIIVLGILAGQFARSRTEAVSAGLSPAMLAAFEAGSNGADGPAFGLAQDLVSRKDHAQPVILVLDKLTRALPGDAWLNTLSINDDTVTLTGMAQNAPSLIGALQGSGALRSVAFSAPTVRSDDGRGAQFTISASLAAQGG